MGGYRRAQSALRPAVSPPGPSLAPTPGGIASSRSVVRGALDVPNPGPLVGGPDEIVQYSREWPILGLFYQSVADGILIDVRPLGSVAVP